MGRSGKCQWLVLFLNESSLWIFVFLFLPVLFWINFCCCEKTKKQTKDQNHLSRGRVYLPYTSSSQSIKRCQVRNWSKAGTWKHKRQQRPEDCCLQASLELVQFAFLNHLHRGSTAHSGLSLPMSDTNKKKKKKSPIDLPIGQFYGIIFSVESPCSQMTEACVNLTKN